MSLELEIHDVGVTVTVFEGQQKLGEVVGEVVKENKSSLIIAFSLDGVRHEAMVIRDKGTKGRWIPLLFKPIVEHCSECNEHIERKN